MPMKMCEIITIQVYTLCPSFQVYLILETLRKTIAIFEYLNRHIEDKASVGGECSFSRCFKYIRFQIVRETLAMEFLLQEGFGLDDP